MNSTNSYFSFDRCGCWSHAVTTSVVARRARTRGMFMLPPRFTWSLPLRPAWVHGVGETHPRLISEDEHGCRHPTAWVLLIKHPNAVLTAFVGGFELGRLRASTH